MPSIEGFKYIPSEAVRFKSPNVISRESSAPKAAGDNYSENTRGDNVVPNRAERRKLDIGKNYVPDGAEIIVQRKPEPQPKIKKPVSQTAEFEARHAVLGLSDLENVSIEPGPGYKGITRLRRYNPVAAAAHVHEGGGGHDAMIIRLHGDDVNRMAALAKSEIGNKRKEIDAVAEALMDEKTLTKDGVHRVIFDAAQERQKREQEKHMADVFVYHPDGSVKKIPNVFAPNGVVYDPASQKIDA